MASITSLQEFAKRIIADLAARGARFAVIGGFAVSIRTEPRFTRDIDFAVSVSTDAEAEALTKSLLSSGYRIFALLEQEAVSRIATVRLSLAGIADERLIVDLLYASSGIEPEVVMAATAELIPGVGKVPVATCGHLLAMKILSRRDKERPNDAADIRALLQVATADDLAEARAATRLIAARGFNRGRDLAALLERAIAEFGSADA